MLREMSQFEGANFDAAAMSSGKYLPVESAMPGTTLGLIPLQAFESGGTLYDTPGARASGSRACGRCWRWRLLLTRLGLLPGAAFSAQRLRARRRLLEARRAAPGRCCLTAPARPHRARAHRRRAPAPPRAAHAQAR